MVEPAAVRDTVRTVGTLVANESVERRRRAVAPPGHGARQPKAREVDAGALALQARRRRPARPARRARGAPAPGGAHRGAPARAARRSTRRRSASRRSIRRRPSCRRSQAQIAALRVTLAKTEIRAPFRARVGLRRVSEGAWITPETPLITLQDTSRIKIDFTPAGALRRRRRDRPGGGLRGRRPQRALRGRGRRDRAGDRRPDPQPAGARRRARTPTARCCRAPSPRSRCRSRSAATASWCRRRHHPVRDRPRRLRRCATAAPSCARSRSGLRTREAVEIRRGLAIGDTVLTSQSAAAAPRRARRAGRRRRRRAAS